MKVNYFLLCESVIIDDTKKVSLIGIFDNLQAEGFPAIPAKLAFAFSVAVTNQDAPDKNLEIKIEVTDSSGKNVLKLEGNGKFEKEGNISSYFDVGGKIAIKSKGKYTAKLTINKKELVSLSFEVTPPISMKRNK